MPFDVESDAEADVRQFKTHCTRRRRRRMCIAKSWSEEKKPIESLSFSLFSYSSSSVSFVCSRTRLNCFIGWAMEVGVGEWAANI